MSVQDTENVWYDVWAQKLSMRWEIKSAYDVLYIHFINPCNDKRISLCWLSGVPDYFGRNKISSGGDLSHYSSASLY